MLNLLNNLSHLLLHVFFLGIVTILVSTELFHEPETYQALLIVALILNMLLLVLYLHAWLTRPYTSAYSNEKQANEAIKSHIENHSRYQNLRISGTSCTSIFTLFKPYVQAMAHGKHLTVFALNPGCKDIIEYLRDCEPDREDVVRRARQELEELRGEIGNAAYREILALIDGENAYGSNLITASIALWKEAHAVAHRIANPGLANGLDIFLFTHLPTLKNWIFDEKVVFIGSYSPMPGGVGINNPIHLIRRNRNSGREIIADCRRTIAFLANHSKTERVKLHL